MRDSFICVVCISGFYSPEAEIPVVLPLAFRFLLIENEGSLQVIAANCECHSRMLGDVAQRLWELRKVTGRCRGGGFIVIDHQNKVITVGGKSGDYGKADLKKTASLIKKCHPSWGVLYEPELDIDWKDAQKNPEKYKAERYYAFDRLTDKYTPEEQRTAWRNAFTELSHRWVEV